MDNKKLIVLMPILLFVLTVFGYLKVFNTNMDNIKFKNEYEKLNEKYYEVKIDKNNKIKYSSYKELYKIIGKGTGIIYLGHNEDNDSRFAIETLLKALKDNEISDTIYYLDIYNDRDMYTIEDNNLVYEKDKNGNEIKGSKEYFKLIEYLDNYLGEYVLYLDDIEFDTNVKRIPIPTIIFVKDGNIVSLESISLEINKEDSYDIFEDDISKMYSTTCDTNSVEPC